MAKRVLNTLVNLYTDLWEIQSTRGEKVLCLVVKCMNVYIIHQGGNCNFMFIRANVNYIAK